MLVTILYTLSGDGRLFCAGPGKMVWRLRGIIEENEAVGVELIVLNENFVIAVEARLFIF